MFEREAQPSCVGDDGYDGGDIIVPENTSPIVLVHTDAISLKDKTSPRLATRVQAPAIQSEINLPYVWCRKPSLLCPSALQQKDALNLVLLSEYSQQQDI